MNASFLFKGGQNITWTQRIISTFVSDGICFQAMGPSYGANNENGRIGHPMARFEAAGGQSECGQKKSIPITF
jgi:hypothetical protein